MAKTISANIYNAVPSDDILHCNCGSGNLTLNLFSVVSNAGKSLFIQKRDTSANTITIYPNGSEKINGTTSLAVTLYNEYVQLEASADGWYVVDSNTESLTNTSNATALTSRVGTLETNSTTASYGASATVTQTVTSLSSSMPKSEFLATLQGNTSVNIVTNGNFTDANNWAPTAGAEAVSSNVYSLTGDGSASWPRTIQDTSTAYVASRKIFVQLKGRVTNANCTQIYARLQGSASGDPQEAFIQTSPTQNTWYTLSGVVTLAAGTGNVRITIAHEYADASTANAKVMEIKEVMAIDLTAEFGAGNEPSAADCNLRYANWFDSVKGSDKSRIKVTGKNLFDGNYEIGTYNGTTGVKEADATIIRCANRIRVSPSSTIKFSDDLSYFYVLYEYDENDYYIQAQVTGSLYTVTNRTHYVRFRTGGNQTNIDVKTQLEVGSSATTYEAYTETSAIMPAVLHSVPNGTKDTFNANTGLYTKNISDSVTIEASWFVQASVNNPVGYNVHRADSLFTTRGLARGTGTATERVGQLFIDNIPAGWGPSWSVLPGINYFSYDPANSNGIIDVLVPTNQSFADAYSGKTFTFKYQLATPTTTQYLPHVLTAEPSGSVIVEPFVADYDFYDGGVSVSTVSYPIASLDYVNIVDKSTGALTPVALSTCTVASGGLSFTSTAITAEDLVDFGYTYTGLSTIPSMTYTPAANLKAIIDENTKNIGLLDSKIEQVRVADLSRINTIALPLGSISATANFSAFIAPYACRIVDVKIVTKDAIAANDTNYWTIALTHKGASGSGTDVIASKTTKSTGGTAFAAFDAWDLGAIDNTYDNFAAGDVATLTFTKTASATSFAEAMAIINYIVG